ncbi:hypothetical protein D3C72_2593660 [compost metagenome]
MQRQMPAGADPDGQNTVFDEFEILDLIDTLIDFFNPQTVWLFGAEIKFALTPCSIRHQQSP